MDEGELIDKIMSQTSPFNAKFCNGIHINIFIIIYLSYKGHDISLKDHIIYTYEIIVVYFRVSLRLRTITKTDIIIVVVLSLLCSKQLVQKRTQIN